MERELPNGEIVVLEIRPQSELVIKIDVYKPTNRKESIYSYLFPTPVPIDEAMQRAEHRRIL